MGRYLSAVRSGRNIQPAAVPVALPEGVRGTAAALPAALDAIRKADIILVVRDGKIIEQGTHEGLLKKQGYYYTLYRNQFEQELSQKTLA